MNAEAYCPHYKLGDKANELEVANQYGIQMLYTFCDDCLSSIKKQIYDSQLKSFSIGHNIEVVPLDFVMKET